MSIILGIKIDDITRAEALNRVSFFLQNGQHTIFTPNPEMLVKAQKDEYFKQVLNSGDLNLCDGMGLWLAMKSKNKKVKIKNVIERIAGVDFMIDICRIAEEQKKSVYFLGSGSDEVVNKTAKNMRKQFPKLKIVGLDKGSMINEILDIGYWKLDDEKKKISNIQYQISSGLSINETENQTLINKINLSKPEILFVAFGMSKQEKWIYENLAKMPSVKIAMGVGGAFDYISGAIPRAPLLMRKFGLEWVYRLCKQPQRFLRVFNATIKFSWLMVINLKRKNQNAKIIE